MRCTQTTLSLLHNAFMPSSSQFNEPHCRGPPGDTVQPGSAETVQQLQAARINNSDLSAAPPVLMCINAERKLTKHVCCCLALVLIKSIFHASLILIRNHPCGITVSAPPCSAVSLMRQ